MRMTGQMVLRDTDMQQKTIGNPLSDSDKLQRGDLIFWQGHAAIMVDHENIIHANGFSMDVVIEPLEEVIIRIAQTYQRYPIAKRRPIQEI